MSRFGNRWKGENALISLGEEDGLYADRTHTVHKSRTTQKPWSTYGTDMIHDDDDDEADRMGISDVENDVA